MTELDQQLKSGESETLEFRERWNESGLQTIAAFANTRGGTLLVGVSDKGRVVGWGGKEADFQAIANQIVDALRVHPSIALEPHERKRVLRIRVTPSTIPVACRGRYYRRVGSTIREVQPEEMGRFFVAKLGIRWDSLTVDFGLDEIDPESVRRFVRMARRRLPQASEEEPIESILRKLDLIQDGKLTRGAILLFGANPQHRFLTAEIHMGRFKQPLTIIDDKLLKGNLLQQLDSAMQLFQQYLNVAIEVRSQIEEGKSMVDALRHKETWDFPLDALREAVINALIHRDYFATSSDIQIRVFDDRVLITNPGGLPEELTVEDLKREHHASCPRNPLLAQVFYYTELIENWGTGTWRMAQMCRAQGFPPRSSPPAPTALRRASPRTPTRNCACARWA
jgi:ATP-dependent DNA helicase RecG